MDNINNNNTNVDHLSGTSGEHAQVLQHADDDNCNAQLLVRNVENYDQIISRKSISTNRFSLKRANFFVRKSNHERYSEAIPEGKGENICEESASDGRTDMGTEHILPEFSEQFASFDYDGSEKRCDYLGKCFDEDEDDDDDGGIRWGQMGEKHAFCRGKAVMLSDEFHEKQEDDSEDVENPEEDDEEEKEQFANKNNFLCRGGAVTLSSGCDSISEYDDSCEDLMA